MLMELREQVRTLDLSGYRSLPQCTQLHGKVPEFQLQLYGSKALALLLILMLKDMFTLEELNKLRTPEYVHYKVYPGPTERNTDCKFPKERVDAKIPKTWKNLWKRQEDVRKVLKEH